MLNEMTGSKVSDSLSKIINPNLYKLAQLTQCLTQQTRMVKMLLIATNYPSQLIDGYPAGSLIRVCAFCIDSRLSITIESLSRSTPARCWSFTLLVDFRQVGYLIRRLEGWNGSRYGARKPIRCWGEVSWREASGTRRIRSKEMILGHAWVYATWHAGVIHMPVLNCCIFPAGKKSGEGG